MTTMLRRIAILGGNRIPMLFMGKRGSNKRDDKGGDGPRQS